jgi:hypothetical protein
MFINITDPNLGSFLLNVKDITKIVENSAGDVTVNLVNSQENYEPSETLDNIFDQQNVTGHSLNMVLITNQRSGLREIWFTHSLLMITPRPGGGSVLHTKVRKEKVEASETVAAILAYQTGKQLGMLDASVVEYGGKEVNPGGTVDMIIMADQIKRITSKDVAVPLGNSICVMINADSRYELDDTVAQIYAAQP